MEIREYRDMDWGQVIDLWADVFSGGHPHNESEKVLNAKTLVQRELLFVAEEGDEIVGTTMAGYDGHRGWLYSVVVHPDHRRQGVGGKLVEHVVDALRDRGCVKVNLQVRATDAEVVAFCCSVGFSTEEHVSMGKLLV